MIILDSNVWIAYIDRNDTTHAQAVNVIDTVHVRGQKVGVPEYVMLETVTMINRLAGKKTSDDFLRFLLNNEDVEVLPSSAPFLQEVIDMYMSYTTKKLSFTDAALLVLARKADVYTFDKKLKAELGR